jgi:hypothetical protein
MNLDRLIEMFDPTYTSPSSIIHTRKKCPRSQNVTFEPQTIFTL